MYQTMGWVVFPGAGDGVKGGILVFALACAWMAPLPVPAIWVLTWADA
jgi:hypothetical protein